MAPPPYAERHPNPRERKSGEALKLHAETPVAGSRRVRPATCVAAVPTPSQSGFMSLPRTASAVIIGGGVVGCSIAYHLVRRGLHDVVVLERETVGSGTTSKAAGGIRVQFSSETEIRFSLESIRVFEGFQEEFGVDPGYRKIGYLYLLSEERHLRPFE